MFSPKDNRRFLLVLAFVTAFMALGMAMTAVSIWRQSRTIESHTRLQQDSMVSLSFQLEREFLRTRHELQRVLSEPDSHHWQTLQSRHEILISRINLINDNPTIAPLTTTDAFGQLLPGLEQLVQLADPLLANDHPPSEGLEAVLDQMLVLGPSVQALSQTANNLVARTMEEQLDQVHQQEKQLFWLLIGQVVILLMASLSLGWRHRQQWQEHRVMQELNTELARARDAAEQANGAKTRFLANMSHELRTPFNGMLLMFEQLERTIDSPEQKDHLATARQSARHLLNLLNDILDMSALDAGKLNVTPIPTPMRDLVCEVRQWMLALADQKGLSMHVVMPDSAPPWVLADATRVRQILLNLLNNAIKFTERGHVSLHVQCTMLAHDEARWELQVIDTGRGMDQDTVARLFKRFELADTSLTRSQGGTGLGLEISRTLARRMGGDITVSSQPGVGSCFKVVLKTPVCPAPARKPLAEPLTALTGLATSDQRRWRILVAEDHPVNRKVLGMMLSKLGHEVSYAEDGLQALDMVQRQNFDLLLMDIHMPRMDGLDSTRAIRALAGNRSRLPIIALTADIMNEAAERSRQAGMNDFIAKPIELTQLEAAMNACMARA